MNAPLRRFHSQSWKCDLWQGVDSSWTSLLRLMSTIAGVSQVKCLGSGSRAPFLGWTLSTAQFIDVCGRNVAAGTGPDGSKSQTKQVLFQDAQHARAPLKLPTGTRGQAA